MRITALKGCQSCRVLPRFPEQASSVNAGLQNNVHRIDTIACRTVLGLGPNSPILLARRYQPELPGAFIANRCERFVVSGPQLQNAAAAHLSDVSGTSLKAVRGCLETIDLRSLGRIWEQVPRMEAVWGFCVGGRGETSKG